MEYSTAQKKRMEKSGKILASYWKNPEKRAKLIAAQKRLGYRNYPVKFDEQS